MDRLRHGSKNGPASETEYNPINNPQEAFFIGSQGSRKWFQGAQSGAILLACSHSVAAIT
jgi:hypothetical protein